MSLHALTLTAVVDEFRKTRAYAEKAFAQLRDDDFFFRLSDRQCSIAAYVRHLSGNMQSRWIDFLTSDGEKPNRNRESEFEEQVVPRERIMSLWEDGWSALFGALATLRPGDLE